MINDNELFANEVNTSSSVSEAIQITIEFTTEQKSTNSMPVKLNPAGVLADYFVQNLVPEIQRVLTPVSAEIIESTDQIPAVQDICEFSVSTPFPDFSIFAACDPEDLSKNGQTFDPKLCVRAKKFIGILIGRILAEFTNLASTHSAKLIILDDCVQMSFRPRVCAEAKSQTLTSEEELLKERYKFFSKEIVELDIESSEPHKEGLTKSAVYTVFASKAEVDEYCKGLKKSYVLTKDQPKDSRLIRFRIFGANKPGFVKGAKSKK